MNVDLRSDTVTQPCEGMKRAMMAAPLGDDVLGDDPTIIELEEKIADLLGKETALFVPSGTMANQLAIWLHTRRGDAVAIEQDAHIFHYEAGAPAILSSVMMRPVQGHGGIMNIGNLKKVIVPIDPHFAPTTLICVEDTANKGGGNVYPTETLATITSLAKTNGLHTHLDGARLFNAQTASGVLACDRVRHFDTVSVCFSKGLGAPVGSALCFPKDRLTEARRARKAMGGGMRQSGILAAAAIYALDNNIDRLEEDHQHIQILAQGLQQAGYTVRPPASNMVYFEAQDASILVHKVEQEGILALALGPTTIRLVAHLQVSTEGMQRALKSFQRHAKEHSVVES